MEQKQLEKLRRWFDNYVDGFYGDDDFVNLHLKLKEEHSRRVCREMSFLADELGLSENQKRIAETIALFHDIGRFKQFVTYRTYSDVKSVNHCLLGLEALREQKVLDDMERNERELINKAIEYHGLKKLPDDLNGECLLLSKMIRDADKLDIFYLAIEYYKHYKEKKEKFLLELEFPNEPGYSQNVIETVLTGKNIDYAQLRTLNDWKLMQLGWVYDVNFQPTLKRIKHRRFLETLISSLPQTEDIKKVKEKICKYVDSKIKKQNLKSKNVVLLNFTF
jgi:putative nucleotidyltransferase with HDIG domain